MEIYKYKISRYPTETMSGVTLGEGEQWLAIKYNPVGYMLDDIRFLNKKYIEKRTDTFENELIPMIIPLKYKDFQKDKEYVSKIDLDTYKGFFSHFLSSDTLLEIGLNDENQIFVGTVTKVNEKSVSIHCIDPDGNDDGIMPLPFNRVRYIGIDSDYLNSLSLYLAQQSSSASSQ